MQRIGVFTSGGDAPGMNACVRAAVRVGVERGVEVMGIRRGYAGLLDDEIEPLDRRAVADIVQRGGTVLGTSRSERFRTEEGRAEAREILARHGIEGLVAIGGDGTFKGAHALRGEGGPPVIGVPGTIDNDVAGTDRTLGFDTAVNTAVEAIDRIRDTAASHELVHVIEVMGRHNGRLALASGLAGGAEAVLVPEVAVDLGILASRIDHGFDRGKRFVILVVSEGFEGGGRLVVDELERRLDRDARVTILGHIQRGGSPTAADRILGSRLGAAAADALLDGRADVMIGEVGGELTSTPLETTWTGSVALDERLVSLAARLA